jgi:hypothetical protein
MVLQGEYEHRKRPIEGISPQDAIIQLNSQIVMYAKGLWPFNRPYNEGDNPLEWWRGFDNHPDAKVLAVCLFLPD